MAESKLREIPARIKAFLEELEDEENEDKYEIFYREHSDKFAEEMARAEERLLKSGFQIEYIGGPTLLETAKKEPLKYKCKNGEETTIYLIGTEHNIRNSCEDVQSLYKTIEPDIIAIEWDMDYKKEEHQALLAVWDKCDGDLDRVLKLPTKELVKAGHFHRDEGFCDKLLEWGTMLSTDMGPLIHLADKFKKKLFFIDQGSVACDRQLGEVWDVTAMYLSMKLLYGIDVIERGLDVENIYQLIAVSDYYNTALMNQETRIGHIVSPESHVLGTHMRDLFMTKRLHQICEGNPGKTILCAVGACHCPGMRELWDYYIPKVIVDTMLNVNKTKRNLQKIVKKYGGSIIKNFQCIDMNKLQKR